jgi:hypothetical protein
MFMFVSSIVLRLLTKIAEMPLTRTDKGFLICFIVLAIVWDLHDISRIGKDGNS